MVAARRTAGIVPSDDMPAIRLIPCCKYASPCGGTAPDQAGVATGRQVRDTVIRLARRWLFSLGKGISGRQMTTGRSKPSALAIASIVPLHEIQSIASKRDPVNLPESDHQFDALLKAAAGVRLADPLKFDASASSIEQVLHELQVHRIELEMQNESLRQSQVALEESRDRYMDFYDHSPVGYITLDAKGLIADINLTGVSMLGMNRKQLRQRRFSPSVDTNDRDRWLRYFVEALRQDGPMTCEIALLRADGSVIDVRLDTLRLCKAGAVTALRMVLTNIGERKAVEAALHTSQQNLAESEDRFSRFMEELPAAAFIKDSNCRMIYGNRYLENFLGVHFLPEKPTKDFVPSDIAQHMDDIDRLALERGRLVVEETVSGKDGEPRCFETHKFRISRPGKPVLLGGIAIDITERKLAEQQLRKLTATLESTVNERTAELRKLAGRLTRTEERERRLLAKELHDDLGQLLAAIKIRLTSLTRKALQPSIDRIVELVDKAEESARGIVRQLSPPLLSEMGVVSALDWLAQEMDKVFGLVVEIHVEGEPNRLDKENLAILYRSVRELLINVAKHAGVALARVTCIDDGVCLTVSVSDEGCGFDTRPRASKSPSKHVGFGLWSIDERISTLGGKMEVDSCPGGGTTIRLVLPYTVAAKEGSP